MRLLQVGLAAAAAWPALAQVAAADLSRGAPQDWSHRHLLFPNPDTRDEASRKGPGALARWQRLAQDPRFAAQLTRKTAWQQPAFGQAFSGLQLQWANRFRTDPPAGTAHRDWSNVLGGASGKGRAGVFPAKYSFDINATPSCANDFIVFTTASSGATGSGAFASQTGTFSNNPSAGQTVTINRTGAPLLVLTASNSSNTGLNYQIGANAAATAANLANAIVRNGGTAGVTATVSANVITVRSLTAGNGSNGVVLTESTTNFSWGGGNLNNGSGTAGQPTIVAFNQLYKSCSTSPTQPVPATFWSYNTGTGATADLSPVLSLDGAQVAFVQKASSQASLVLLKWSSASPGTVGNPTTPTSVTAANYRACTAPCMTVIPFNGTPNDSYSSPFYDYAGDVLYVGDDAGKLHKFTDVFNGTPAEQTTGGFPATVSSGNALTSPVYDSGTGLVLVGSDTGAASGGQLHSVDASGNVLSSAPLAAYTIAADGNNTTGVRDGPIVDSTAGRAYVFVESGRTLNCGGAECKTVYQFTIPFAGGAAANARAELGRGQKYYRTLYGGMFDNTYFTSADPTSPTGALYVCGTLADGSNSQRPTLWKIPITNNVMGTPAAGPTFVTSDAADCSPVTEITNGANDYLYVSVGQNMNGTGGLTGCTSSGTCTIYMINLTGKTWSTSVTADASLTAASGTSGIIVDNISATAGASQVYYSTLASPGNAVQASQAGLQ